MHFRTLVLIPEKGDVLDCVTAAMEPWNEVENSRNGFWDWWQVGGRQSGLLSGYDPDKDPKNQVPCEYCGATGKRNDQYVQGPCNGCGGTGKRTTWPTQWLPHEGDVVPSSRALEVLRGDLTKLPYTLVTEDGRALHKKKWSDKKAGFVETRGFGEMVMKELEKHLGRTVVVDYHC